MVRDLFPVALTMTEGFSGRQSHPLALWAVASPGWGILRRKCSGLTVSLVVPHNIISGLRMTCRLPWEGRPLFSSPLVGVKVPSGNFYSGLCSDPVEDLWIITQNNPSHSGETESLQRVLKCFLVGQLLKIKHKRNHIIMIGLLCHKPYLLSFCSESYVTGHLVKDLLSSLY